MDILEQWNWRVCLRRCCFVSNSIARSFLVLILREATVTQKPARVERWSSALFLKEAGWPTRLDSVTNSTSFTIPRRHYIRVFTDDIRWRSTSNHPLTRINNGREVQRKDISHHQINASTNEEASKDREREYIIINHPLFYSPPKDCLIWKAVRRLGL